MFDLIKLLRPQQWYKNILVFVALFYAKAVFNTDAVILTVLGFISLCLISSANYVINDIIDINRDRVHPEKKNRPLASGKISITSAAIMIAALFVAATVLAYSLSPEFFYLVLILFLSSLLYSIFFKNMIFLDVIAISINFVFRAMSGAFILDVEVSPWLIITVFFLAMFLVTGKRRADIDYLGNRAALHKEVLGYYDKPLLDAVLCIFASALIATYSFYSFIKQQELLLITLPIVLYGILTYFSYILDSSDIARNPEKSLKDPKLLITMVLWFAASAFVIYA